MQFVNCAMINERWLKAKYAELPGALPLGPPPGLRPGPTTGGLQRSADLLLISSCLRHEKRAPSFYKLNLEHKNGGMTKCLEKPLHL